MTRLLDTNVLVRYLRNDDQNLAGRAARLIDSDHQLYISEVTLAEVGYVLTHHYREPRDRVVTVLMDLIERENLSLLDLETDRAVEALRLCLGSARVSFADALLWAAARTRSPATVYSFDRRFPSEGIELSWPE